MALSASRLATSIGDLAGGAPHRPPFFCSSSDIFASTKLWWSPPKRRKRSSLFVDVGDLEAEEGV